LSIPGHVAVTGAHIARIEAAVERYNADLPMLKEFILPGGTRAGAACHLARAICRRAERAMVALGRVEGVSELSIHYMNRVSDLLFIAARCINRAAGEPETLWNPGREREK
jgi:cob(I)alamin adenosyltransferase